MAKQPVSRALLIFYLLTTYIVIQFAWWAWHIIKVERIIYADQPEATNRVWMILGESAVFLAILIVAALVLRKAIKKEYQIANNQKNFMLAVTHELKTPLASIRLFLQTLNKRALEPAEQKQLTGKAIAETDRLNGIIENILVAGGLGSGQNIMQRSSADLTEFIKSFVEQWHSHKSFKREIKTEIEGNVSFAFDTVAMNAILTNLIDNAIKYSNDEAPVVVGLKQDENAIYLRVEDQGEGIAAIEKRKIFERFYRVGDERTRSAKGTGLGLYIVNELVKLHNGKIGVSDNKPHGSVFNIQFAKA